MVATAWARDGAMSLKRVLTNGLKLLVLIPLVAATLVIFGITVGVQRLFQSKRKDEDHGE
jgi:hypothetical protein